MTPCQGTKDKHHTEKSEITVGLKITDKGHVLVATRCSKKHRTQPVHFHLGREKQGNGIHQQQPAGTHTSGPDAFSFRARAHPQ